MNVRAEWNGPALLADVDVDAWFAQPERVEDVGTPIVLTGETAELDQALVRTVEREARLYADGVTCKIKDVGDASCHACPLFRQDGSSEAELCAVGREQERLCTLIAVRRHG